MYSVPFFNSTHVPTIERNESFSDKIGRPFIDGVRKRMPYPISISNRVVKMAIASNFLTVFGLLTSTVLLSASVLLSLASVSYYYMHSYVEFVSYQLQHLI